MILKAKRDDSADSEVLRILIRNIGLLFTMHGTPISDDGFGWDIFHIFTEQDDDANEVVFPSKSFTDDCVDGLIRRYNTDVKITSSAVVHGNGEVYRSKVVVRI